MSASPHYISFFLFNAGDSMGFVSPEMSHSCFASISQYQYIHWLPVEKHSLTHSFLVPFANQMKLSRTEHNNTWLPIGCFWSIAAIHSKEEYSCDITTMESAFTFGLMMMMVSASWSIESIIGQASLPH